MRASHVNGVVPEDSQTAEPVVAGHKLHRVSHTATLQQLSCFWPFRPVGQKQRRTRSTPPLRRRHPSFARHPKALDSLGSSIAFKWLLRSLLSLHQPRQSPDALSGAAYPALSGEGPQILPIARLKPLCTQLLQLVL